MYAYTYDAEGRLATVTQGTTLLLTNTYDASGRVAEEQQAGCSAIHDYAFDPWGQRELDLWGWWNPCGFDALEWMGLPGGSQAFYNENNMRGTYFTHLDALGTATAMTDQSGGLWGQDRYYPFGQMWIAGGWMATGQRYAGTEHRDPLGMDATQLRAYASTYGRWMTPDPMGGDISNPQSLNRYAYALNNPETLTDPLGLTPTTCINGICGGDSGDGLIFAGGGGGGCSPNDLFCDGGSPLPPVFFPVWPVGGGGGGGTTGGGSGGAAGGGGGTRTTLPSAVGNAGFPQSSLPDPWQLSWPYGGLYPCDFGYCVPVLNPWTAQVAGSININLWILSFNFAGGFAIDSHGHVASYTTKGAGPSPGGAGSIGTQVAISNAATVCDLGGPFVNASGTFGAGGSVSADVFQGPSPNGTVTGGGVTAGAGIGASGSVGVTTTTVVPIGGAPCK